MVNEYIKGSKVQISPHFNSSEFDCHCNYPECDFTYIDSDLIDYLELKRNGLGKPLHVNSGYRCTRHNKDVGGKRGSIHPTGKAADISFGDTDITDKSSLFQDADGLGIYKKQKFLHVDVRGYTARWFG